MELFKNNRVYLFLIFIFTAWALLFRLDAMPLFLWDESRQANNALEMMQSGNYLFPTYNGLPDFWNTKPHLLIIIQAISFKILGPGLISLRLPSALAGIFTVLIWFRFFQNRNQLQVGILTVFILLTCGGFNAYHITRTGDYDALLLLFFTLAVTRFYKILFDTITKKDLYLFYLFLSLAILTKGLAMAFWVPVFIFLFFIYRKQINHKFITLITPVWTTILVTVLYYTLREMVSPGYLNAVWENEIAGRYFAPNEGHISPWYYYADEIWRHYFQGYWILFLIGFILVFLYNIETEAKFWFRFSLFFVVFISTSKTRIHWYMAPAIPCMAAATALAIEDILKRIQQDRMRSFAGIFVYTSIAVIGAINWLQLWHSNTFRDGVHPQVVLQDAVNHGKFSYNGIWILGDYNPMEDYYGKLLKAKNIPFRTTKSFKMKPGDTVIIHRQDFLDSLGKYNNNLQIHVPDFDNPVWVLKVESVR